MNQKKKRKKNNVETESKKKRKKNIVETELKKKRFQKNLLQKQVVLRQTINYSQTS